MGAALFPIDYIGWHYTRGVKDFLRIAGNLLWFVANLFSIGLLFRTLFAPWMRLREEKKKQGFDAEELFGNSVVNTMMRLIGFCIRMLTIIAGLIALLLVLAAAVVGFIVWLLLPAIILVLIILGLSLIFL